MARPCTTGRTLEIRGLCWAQSHRGQITSERSDTPFLSSPGHCFAPNLRAILLSAGGYAGLPTLFCDHADVALLSSASEACYKKGRRGRAPQTQRCIPSLRTPLARPLAPCFTHLERSESTNFLRSATQSSGGSSSGTSPAKRRERSRRLPAKCE